jgi:hypothetical protein
MAVQFTGLSIKQTILLLAIAFLLELPVFTVCFLFSFGIGHISAEFAGIFGLVNIAVSLVVVMVLYRRWMTKVR